MPKKNGKHRREQVARNGAGAGRDRRPAQLPCDELEASVAHLAASGELAKAGRRAVRSQLSKGIAVTYKRGDRIIKQHPGGHEEVVGRVEPRPYVLPEGVTLIDS